MLKADFIKHMHGVTGISDYIFKCYPEYNSKLLSKYGATIEGRFFCDSCLQIGVSEYRELRDFSNLRIDANVSVGKNVYIDLSDKVNIEDDVAIAPGVMILTHASVINRPLKKEYPEKSTCHNYKGEHGLELARRYYVVWKSEKNLWLVQAVS
jgi:acetyltransferase-like isoleucine patch superfamily enzyme